MVRRKAETRVCLTDGHLDRLKVVQWVEKSVVQMVALLVATMVAQRAGQMAVRWAAQLELLKDVRLVHRTVWRKVGTKDVMKVGMLGLKQVERMVELLVVR